MRLKSKNWKINLLALAAVAGYVINGQTQSADALLDKLVDKGILTVKEANELRVEADKDFDKAYSAKSGMPEWVSALKFGGDFRGRYESFYFDNANGVDRHRFRYRLRFGVTAALSDSFEAGFRLGSGDFDGGVTSGLDPISNNQSLQNNASKKGIFLDLAYGKWTPLRTEAWQGGVTFGKMENPFVFSDMIFDGDYTPEGAALQLNYNLSEQHVLRLNGGAFVLDEIGAQSEDPYMYGVQLRLDSAWSTKLSSSVGVGYLGIENEQALATTINGAPSVPNVNVGNTRGVSTDTSVGTLVNALIYDYHPIVGDASVTYTLDEFWHYKAPFPIKLGGDYMYNPNAGTENKAFSAGITFGKAGKKGLWEFSYRYKYLEADAWYEELVDSDFGGFYQVAPTGGTTGYGAGTNVKGHILKAAYSPYNPLTLTVTAFFTELINPSPAGSETSATRIQADATLKF